MKGKFLGDTKGNRDLPPNCSAATGGEGEMHSSLNTGKFLGGTKGNTDLPVDRTAGVKTGYGGGPHKAGGMGKKTAGYGSY